MIRTLARFLPVRAIDTLMRLRYPARNVDPEYLGRTHTDEKDRVVSPDLTTTTRRAANSSAMAELRKRAVGKSPDLALPYGPPSVPFQGTSDDFYAEIAKAYGEGPIETLPPDYSPADCERLLQNGMKSERRRNSMAVQVGGDHYRKTAMQPFEFTLANGWDGAAHTILKYIARCEDKGGAQDLEKAFHVTLIRADHLPRDIETAKPRPWANPISIDVYCAVNGYEGHKRLALVALARWVDQPGNDWNRMKVESAIQDYLAVAYPVPGL